MALSVAVPKKSTEYLPNSADALKRLPSWSCRGLGGSGSRVGIASWVGG